MAESRRYATSLLVVILAAAGATVRAQSDELLDPEIRNGPGRRLSVDVSGGWASTSLFGGVTDEGRGTLQAALHAHVPLIAGRGFELDYTGGIVPVELARGTRIARSGTSPLVKTVYGAGLDVLGLTLRFRRSNRWELYLTTLGGVRLFTDPVPNPRGLRFNFSADIGGGIAARIAPGQRVKVGFFLHHLSNGGLGRTNPSFNGFTVTFGFEGFRSRASGEGPP